MLILPICLSEQAARSKGNLFCFLRTVISKRQTWWIIWVFAIFSLIIDCFKRLKVPKMSSFGINVTHFWLKIVVYIILFLSIEKHFQNWLMLSLCEYCTSGHFYSYLSFQAVRLWGSSINWAFQVKPQILYWIRFGLWLGYFTLELWKYYSQGHLH